jgi:hypothetical protein
VTVMGERAFCLLHFTIYIDAMMITVRSKGEVQVDFQFSCTYMLLKLMKKVHNKDIRKLIECSTPM